MIFAWWEDILNGVFRGFLPIETKQLSMGRQISLFLGILMEFLLAIRSDFFCMGRTRLKMIEIFLAIELKIDCMGRNKLKIGI